VFRGVDRIQLAQERVQWRAYVNMRVTFSWQTIISYTPTFYKFDVILTV